MGEATEMVVDAGPAARALEAGSAARALEAGSAPRALEEADFVMVPRAEWEALRADLEAVRDAVADLQTEAGVRAVAEENRKLREFALAHRRLITEKAHEEDDWEAKARYWDEMLRLRDEALGLTREGGKR